MTGIYDRQAARYDAWYDSPTGRAILQAEADALRPLLDDLPRPWLEVGVGTGRFAMEFRVDAGLDPALSALRLASQRNIVCVAGQGEALPFVDRPFGAVLIALTLPFVRDAEAVLREARRVLRPDGALILGTLPADGPWGRHYQNLGTQGHAYYRDARFLSRTELSELLERTGFLTDRIRTALWWAPDGEPCPERPREGDDPVAGFRALRCRPRSSTV